MVDIAGALESGEQGLQVLFDVRLGEELGADAAHAEKAVARGCLRELGQVGEPRRACGRLLGRCRLGKQQGEEEARDTDLLARCAAAGAGHCGFSWGI